MLLRSILNQYKKGQNLSEYGLAIGLTVIVGIAGLSLLGTRVSGLLGNTISSNNGNRNVIATNPNPNPNPNGSGLGRGIGGFFLSPQQADAILDKAPTQTLDLGNGKKLTIPNPNSTTLSETLGPNGSTEVGLALLRRLEAALKAQGIDPATVIPEMGYFANAAHGTSDIQKQAEIFLKSVYEKNSLQGYNSGNNYIASLDNGSIGVVKFVNYEFSKDAQGNYLVKNYMDGKGNTNPNFIPMSDIPVQDRMNLASVMTQRKLASDPALASIQPTFNTIWKNINNGTNNIANSMDIRHTVPTWLNTKIEANKACLLSNAGNCIQ